jgi:5-methylcytosine-specific restriction endonuclease McrA
MILLLLMKAEIVAEQENRFIRTVNRAFPFPSVIRLQAYIRVPYKKIELSRKNVLRRDNMKCQYCGKKSSQMTIDHIVPKSRGGQDSWDNLVAACVRCNNKKGNRTPDEAGLKLQSRPTRPHHIFFIQQFMGAVESSWKPFLFLD